MNATPKTTEAEKKEAEKKSDGVSQKTEETKAELSNNLSYEEMKKEEERLEGLYGKRPVQEDLVEEFKKKEEFKDLKNFDDLLERLKTGKKAGDKDNSLGKNTPNPFLYGWFKKYAVSKKNKKNEDEDDEESEENDKKKKEKKEKKEHEHKNGKPENKKESSDKPATKAETKTETDNKVDGEKAPASDDDVEDLDKKKGEEKGSEAESSSTAGKDEKGESEEKKPEEKKEEPKKKGFFGKLGSAIAWPFKKTLQGAKILTKAAVATVKSAAKTARGVVSLPVHMAQFGSKKGREVWSKDYKEYRKDVTK